MQTETAATTKTPKVLKEGRLHVPVEHDLLDAVAAEIALANSEGDDLNLSSLTRRLLRGWLHSRRKARGEVP